MATSTQNHYSETDNSQPNYKWLYITGGAAAFLQLVTITAYSIALAVLGPKPTSAEEYFLVQQKSAIEMVLRGDFLLLILIGLYLFTFSALYIALRKVNPVGTAFATLFTFMAVVLTFANESTFSLLNLGAQYAAATDAVLKAQFLAAGEAVIASDMWHSSGAYMSGILLQGSGVMISIIMLRSKDFSKVTAVSGLIGNGLDLIQHVLHPFAPSISSSIQIFMGVFYLVWFLMLGLDLIRLGLKPRHMTS
jgi:hypothetical protein